MDVDIEIPENFHSIITQDTANRVKTAVSAALFRAAEEIAVDAKVRAPKAFSLLTNSIKTKKINANEVHIVAGAKYAMYIEQGIPPGKFPSLYGLEKWAKIKNILQGRTSREVAYLIGRKIQKTGIKANPFMKETLDAKTERVTQLVQEAIINAVR